MKLQSQKKKNITIVAIIVAIVVVVAIIAVAIGFAVVNHKDDKIVGIIVSVSPKNSYYIGEAFDPTGLILQVKTEDGDSSYPVSYNKRDFMISGFDSTAVNEKLPVTVTYQGFSTVLYVEIKDYPPKTPVLQSIRLSKDLTFSLSFWNRFGPVLDDVNLILTYSDGSEKSIPMLTEYCSMVKKPVDSVGTTDFLVTYSDGVTTIEQTITVTITD